MSSFTKRYATNETAAEEGVFVDFGDGIQVKVARFDNKQSRDLRRKLEKPYRNILQRNRQLPPELEEKLAIQQIAEAVIKDWKGITDENGKEIKFTPEAAKEILTKYPDFLNDVLTVSMERDLFRQEALEEDVKNS